MTHTANAQSDGGPQVSIHTEGDEKPSATELLVNCFTEYSRERPEVVTLWAFGIGFVLGWKLKPW